MAEVFVKQFIASHKTPPKELMMDFDATDADCTICHDFLASQFRLLLGEVT